MFTLNHNKIMIAKTENALYRAMFEELNGLPERRAKAARKIDRLNKMLKHYRNR